MKLVDQNTRLPLFHKPIIYTKTLVGKCYNILQDNRYFQVFIFPSAILEWNRLERKIRQSTIMPLSEILNYRLVDLLLKQFTIYITPLV